MLPFNRVQISLSKWGKANENRIENMSYGKFGFYIFLMHSSEMSDLF